MFQIIKKNYFYILLSNFLLLLNAKEYENNINDISKNLSQALNIINSKSYYEINIDNAIKKAIEALASVDSHSKFLDESAYQDLIDTTQGEFYGIGVRLKPNKINNALSIKDIIHNSPAQIAGIQKNDLIIKIDNLSVEELTFEKAIEKLKSNKKDSIVKLEILRNKKILKFNIKRDVIKDPHIFFYNLKNLNILYLNISVFDQQISSKIKNFLKNNLKDNIKGIIIDLSNNSGGLVDSAAECCNYFLKRNSLVVTTKNKDNKMIEKLITNKDPIVSTNMPIIILINKYTASAAEIFSGALRIHSKNNKSQNQYIFLIGNKTVGKGSVQEIIPISNNCAIKLTTCLYYLPDNKSIDSIGLEPDFYIKNKFKENKKIEKLKNNFKIDYAINLIEKIDEAKLNSSDKINTREKALNYLKKFYCFNKDIVLEEIK